MTKFLKIILIIFLSFFVATVALLCAYFAITRDAVLDKNKLITPNRNITVYDDNGEEIICTSLSNKNKSVKLTDLNENCKNAFIASEDRTFYSHRGLNYKRMLKALYKNVTAGSFKEGASTISQQLIKNTHLSGDKTIKRKLNEIRLTKQLEKIYSKDEILEMYLNTIYFGHNCYGLQSAAEFYFDKKAENLDLTESATLVGLLASPNNYSPFKNPEKSLKKRNNVLKAMSECNFIDEKTYNEAIKTPLNAVMHDYGQKNGDYLNAVFDELEELNITSFPEEGFIIKTYLSPSLQEKIENLDFEYDNSVIITTSSGGVSAYKSTINGAKRQPGSTIKPFLVYAPAMDEKILQPYTRIADEKIDYNGYSPENFDKKYHGYVTVTESLTNSYNIPAVKTLNALTIKNAEKYLSRMNIELEDDDKNLPLALGGMKYGLSLKDIADRYTIFSNRGIYSPSHFIKEIKTRNNKTIYSDEKIQSRVFSEGCASLMNEMLLETSKSGTAKKLSSLKYDVASKTGTCGTTEGNTDAYTISYTSSHTVGVWLGDKDMKKLNITGGKNCCEIVKGILDFMYSDSVPAGLDTISGTKQINLDAEDYYTKNKTVLADDISPKLNVLTVKTMQGCEPIEKSTKFSSPVITKPQINVENNVISISLCQTKYYAYIVKRYFNGKYDVIYDGKWMENIQDSPMDGTYTYSVTPYFTNGEDKIYGKEITLPPVNIDKNNSSVKIKIPDITNKEWYNL